MAVVVVVKGCSDCGSSGNGTCSSSGRGKSGDGSSSSSSSGGSGDGW